MQEVRALVVDDSKVGRLTMSRKLEPMGIRVDAVESGQQALDFLAHTRPDLIFMDHMMPDLDGFETTRRIKASPATRDIPVVIVSGNDEPEFVREAREAGALDAIAKPPATEILERLLASLSELAAQATPEPEVSPIPATGPAAVPATAETVQGLTMEEVGDLLAGLGNDLRAEFESRQEARDAALDTVRQQLAGVDALHRRLDGLAQQLDAVEAAATRPLPDVGALRLELERHIDAELARQADHGEAWAPALESLRRDLWARMEEHAAFWKSEGEALRDRLDGLAEELGRLDGARLAAEEAWAARQSSLERTAAEAPHTVPEVSNQDAAETPVYLLLQSELEALNERVGDAHLRQLVANVVAETPPPSLATANDTSLRSELTELRAGLKRLGTFALAGGVALLVALGLTLILK